MLLRQSATYLAGKLIPAAMTFGLIAVYTRLLSPADYGVYAFVNATVSLVFSLSAMWLCTSALRLYAAAEDKNAIRSSLAVGFAVVVGVACLAALIAGLFVSAQNRILLAIGFGLFVFTAWFEINADILTARLKAGRCVAMGITRTILAGALGALFAYLGFGIQGMLIGTLIGIAIPATLMTAEQWHDFRPSRAHAATLKQLLLFGLPLSLSYAVNALVYATDRYIVGAVGGAALLGLYAVGFDLADRLVKSITQPLGTASLPLLVARYETAGVEGARAQAVQNLTLLAAIVTPACLGLIAVTPELTQLMLGEAYRGMAQTIIPIIALTALFSGLRGQYFDYAFHLGLRTDRHVLVVGIMALVNLVAGLILIHIVGAEGAALGTLLAYATGLCASIVLGRRVFPLPAIPGTLARIGVAALIMMVGVSLVPLSDPLAALIVKAPLGALIYGALLLAFDVAGLKAFLIARLPRFRRAGSLEA